MLLHFNGEPGRGFSEVLPGSVNQYILLWIESFAACMVNVFIIITGYFSIHSKKREINKVICLLIQVSFVRVVAVVIMNIQAGGLPSIRTIIGAALPVNYFVVLYFALYLLMPYINLVLNSLSKNGRKKSIIISMILLAVWPTLVDVLQCVTNMEFAGLSTIALQGSGNGYTLINFVFMYSIGATLRLEEIQWKTGKAGIIVLLCIAVLTFWGKYMPAVSWSYCNPLIIVEAVALFLFFLNLRINSTIINRAARASFMCFLIHPYLIPLFNVEKIVAAPFVQMIIYMLFISCMSYVASWLCYEVYVVIEMPIRSLVSILTKNIDLSMEER